MPSTVTILATLLAGVAGACLPRAAYRLSTPLAAPARSACAACATPFPTGPAGWVRLPSRCAGCGASLGAPAWVAAAVGAIAGGGLAASPTLSETLPAAVLLPASVLVTAVALLLSLIDIACMRLPDVIVLPCLATGIAGLAAASVVAGSATPMTRALLAAVALAGFYLVLGFVIPSGVGLGDVKLVLVLGLLLGWLGWGFVFAGAIVAHLIHGATAVGLLAAGRAGRKTLLPMGPALLAGAWCAVAIVPRVFGA